MNDTTEGICICVRNKNELTEQEKRYLEWKEKRDKEIGSDEE